MTYNYLLSLTMTLPKIITRNPDNSKKSPDYVINHVGNGRGGETTIPMHYDSNAVNKKTGVRGGYGISHKGLNVTGGDKSMDK
jgi:hypothetical protein